MVITLTIIFQLYTTFKNQSKCLYLIIYLNFSSCLRLAIRLRIK